MKLRLRGIDTEELTTPGGPRAKDHLAGLLDAAEGFVVTTTKIDLYDRYLEDLFVPKDQASTDVHEIASQGVFVNRAMITEGLARLWTDVKPPGF